MRTDEIRRSYLEYFRSKGHEVAASDSLVPKDDPSLLFTGAGMNQFKEKFMGRNITYSRVTTSQKCLRTGDLDNVGRTSGHHTFFEMLGNFSFGDYFKNEAILWAWEYLTGVLKIDKDRLWVSVYKDDEDAYNTWKDVIMVPPVRIMRFGEKDNYWPSEAPSKGPNGPCGPCSEIFFDWGAGSGCEKKGCDPSCDCGRFIEIWNLVFTQFDRQQDGSLKPLPNKNIDTGMGLERISAVMQGVKTNFEIDIFKPIIAEIENAIAKDQRPETGDRRPETGDRRPKTEDQRPKINAIADHMRAATFTIFDGVMPSNEERGYVVRKLIRRSAAYLLNLKIKPPFLYKLVSPVIEAMKPGYPEIADRRDDIAQVIKREEENFIFVLETQIPMVKEAFRKTSGCNDARALAASAFNFYDTYGMPYDMLDEMAGKHGLKIDKAIFGELLDDQRKKSRSKSKIKSEIFSDTFAKRVEALGLKTEFLGYDRCVSESKILAVLDGGEVILDKTPFYGESGGQAGDRGIIETSSGRMDVEDSKKIGNAIVHIGTMLSGDISKGQAAKVSIDEASRVKIMRNHTATHLLQSALRKVLGEHVHQTGSMVDADHLRFDFTHMKKMEDSQIASVEELVNGAIKMAIPVAKYVMSLDKAKDEGATALFGEKYDREVRVVSIGDVSKELCGGTHVVNTSEIGIFKITSESSTASGVRRIEAVTGDEARKWTADKAALDKQKQYAEREKETARIALGKRIKDELDRSADIVSAAKDASGVKFISSILDNSEMDILRALADKINPASGCAVVLLAARNNDKVSFVLSVTEDVAREHGLNANYLAKEMAKCIGGSGGGRPDFAQGGGKDPSRVEEAFEKIYDIVKERCKR